MAETVHRRAWPKLVTGASFALAAVVTGLAARPLILDELAIRKLASPDEGARREAAAWLAERECVRAIPALLAVPMLSTPHSRGSSGGWRIHRPPYVEEALERLVSPRAAAVVRALALEGNPEERSWALQAFAGIGDRSDEAFQAAAAAIQEEDLQVEAASALSVFGQGGAPYLLAAVKAQATETTDMATMMMYSFSNIGPAARSAVPELVGVLQRPLPANRHDIYPYRQGLAAFVFWALGEDMVEVDLASLESPEGDVRQGAAARLGQFLSAREESADLMNALGALSRLPGQTERVRAVLKLLEDGSGEAELSRLAGETLSETNQAVREGFLAVLAELGPVAPASLAVLRQFLRWSDGEVQLPAARVLWRIEGHRDEAMAVLRELAAAGDVRALDALGESGLAARGSAPVLISLLEDARHDVRMRAAVALAQVDPDAGLQAAARTLFDGLRAQDDDLHDAAAGALEVFPSNPASVPLLKELLADPDGEVRAFAALLVLRLGDSGRPAAPELRANLAHSEQGVRGVAALALWFLGEETDEVRTCLFEREESRSESVTLVAFPWRKLPALDSRPYFSLLARPDTPKLWRRAAAGALAWSWRPLQVSSIPPEILKLLRNRGGDGTVRAQVAMAVASAGPAVFYLVPDILDALGERGGSGMIPQVLARIGPACVPHVVRTLEGPVPVELRAALALALGRMGAAASEAAPALARLLDDPDASVAITAADALGRMGRAAGPAVARLEKLAATGDPEPARQAARALERIAGRPEGFAPITRQYGHPFQGDDDQRSRVHEAVCTRGR